MSYNVKQGDIVWIDFDPSVGNEIRKRRPGLVISADLFNSTTGFAVVVPIKSRPGTNPLEITLPAGMQTSGSLQTHQLRSMYLAPRNPKLIEKAPDELVQRVCSHTQLMLTAPVT